MLKVLESGDTKNRELPGRRTPLELEGAMTTEKSEPPTGKGKARTFFRRKQLDGSRERGSDEGVASTETHRNDHKLNWSPRGGHKDSALLEDHPWDDPASKQLHWSPGLGRDRKRHDAGEGLVIDNRSPTLQAALRVGGSPHSDDSENDGKKFAWLPRHSEQVSESVSDDVSEEGSTKKETVAQRLHQLRRRLNPHGKKAHWRYRIGDHRIDEEAEKEAGFPMDDLDPLEGFHYHGEEHCSTAGDLDVPERINFLSYQRVTSKTMDLAGHKDAPMSPSGLNASPPRTRATSCAVQGIHAESYDTSHRRIRAVTYDGDGHNLEAFHPARSVTSGAFSEGKSARKSKSENKTFRVKPFHCFAPEVVYMTEAEIHHSMIQPSEKIEFLQSYIVPSSKQTKRMQVCDETERMWGNTRDGRIGSLRVEVLTCICLATVKPDVAVYLICGDVPFVSDTIQSCRSPMWPPNSKRAAVFPIHHAYARLYAGVFATKKDKNDVFCGRIVLDLAALRPNTEYDVTLPLRASSFIYDRRPRGVIRLRFSLHWFSERAAVLSYLKSPHSLVAGPGEDNPSVPCGDPKTFRNVAFTVHGQDLPGKYTHKAFQATMREFNLSRLNLIFLVKTLATDAMMYEQPLLSLYLFLSWMHCIYLDSVKPAPAYFVGYLIFHLFENYERYNQNSLRHLGYAPPTLQELLYSLFAPPGREHIHPVQVSKVVNRNQMGRWSSVEKPRSNVSELSDVTVGGDVEPLNNREFPFSEMQAYPVFRAEDAIAPKKHSGSTSKSMTHNQYLSERLSRNVSQGRECLQLIHNASGDEDDWEATDNDELDENDSEDITGDFDLEFTEIDDEDDEEEEGVNRNMPRAVKGSLVRRMPCPPQDTEDDEEEEGESHNMHHAVKGSFVRWIPPLGPPQDTDVKPLKRVPPQLILSRVENMLHRFTFGLSMDKLYQSTLSAGRNNGRPLVSPVPENSDGNGRRRKRIPLDDYDKRLGLRTRSKNPVLELSSSFLGPLMRMFRIFVVVTRVVFNICIWKDPFLSFWVLCFLLALMFILVIFPWRHFMFLVGLRCFGPQNILVGRRMRRRAAAAAGQENEIKQKEEKEQEQEGEEMMNRDSHEDTPSEDSDHSGSDPLNTTPEETPFKDSRAQRGSLGPRRRLQNKIAQMKERRRVKKQESSVSTEEPPPVPPRPAFVGVARHPKSSKVPLEPREVVVPYTRIRTERFYYWPPDPAVSRATPVALLENEFIEGVSIPAPDEDVSQHSHLRRRFTAGNEKVSEVNLSK